MSAASSTACGMSWKKLRINHTVNGTLNVMYSRNIAGKVSIKLSSRKMKKNGRMGAIGGNIRMDRIQNATCLPPTRPGLRAYAYPAGTPTNNARTVAPTLTTILLMRFSNAPLSKSTFR